jgi:hypothetical protein
MELERRAQSVSSQSTVNAELSDWLDQSQKHFLRENQAGSTTPNNHDESSKQELGFISALYQANLSLYGEIYKQCRLGSRCPQESQARISQNLGRFVFLSEVLEHRKIDLCLGKAPEISDITVKQLYNIGKTLTNGMNRPKGGPDFYMANKPLYRCCKSRVLFRKGLEQLSPQPVPTRSCNPD